MKFAGQFLKLNAIANNLEHTKFEVPHVESTPSLPSAADLDAVEVEKDIADSTAKAESAKGRVSRRP